MRWLMAIGFALVVLIGLFASKPTLVSRGSSARVVSPTTANKEADTPAAKWALESLGESVCRLTAGPESVSASFTAYLPGPDWQTRLVRGTDSPIKGSSRYTLRFEAKADAPRSMIVGVGEAGRTGGSLGLREAVTLTPDWMPFQFSFAARFDCDAPQIQWDIGASPVAVSIRAVALTEEDGQ